MLWRSGRGSSGCIAVWVGLGGVLRATATAAGPEAVDSKAQTAEGEVRVSFSLVEWL